MEKHIAVKVSGTDQSPLEATIRPGTTCGDLLDALGLSRNLVLTQDPAGVPFGAEETIFDKVTEGAKLYATPQMAVGEK